MFYPRNNSSESNFCKYSLFYTCFFLKIEFRFPKKVEKRNENPML